MVNLNSNLIFWYSSGIEMVAKRAVNPLLHIDFIWNLTESAKRLREYSRYGHDLFRKVIALPPILHTVWMNDSGVFLFLTTMQIHNEKVQNGSDSYSFLEIQNLHLTTLLLRRRLS